MGSTLSASESSNWADWPAGDSTTVQRPWLDIDSHGWLILNFDSQYFYDTGDSIEALHLIDRGAEGSFLDWPADSRIPIHYDCNCNSPVDPDPQCTNLPWMRWN
ncbi:hypothetical protein Ciccas_007447 [Cichlidogyrus casuarinus]|uniref:Uncharacterized protein n=1 Tax=Cichlidogyrus casuarinus TaxID=1844966 RepID=A0ABD2Q2V6_9PLAT